MQSDERNQIAERWLDEALGRYSDAEPSLGLEARILGRLTDASTKHRPAWKSRLVLAYACAAVMFVAIGVAVIRHKPVSSTTSLSTAQLTVSQAPLPSVVAVSPPHPATAIRPLRVARRQTKQSMIANKQPQKPQFPVAMPLSNQQGLVLAYVSATPVEELMKVSAEQRAWQERVESGANAGVGLDPAPSPDINHLSFPPLESGSTQPGTSNTR